MAKKAQIVPTEDVPQGTIESAAAVSHGPPEVSNGALLATQVELGVGAHLMGQTLTMSASRGSRLEVGNLGITAKSQSGRVMLIPWTNIKCIELTPATSSKPRRR
jgi:hypothetical protein